MPKDKDRLHAYVQQILANAIREALTASHGEILETVAAAVGQSVGAGQSIARKTVRASARPAPKRSWPTCSEPACRNSFFGPSGSARLCYEHYVASGGQHPARSGLSAPGRGSAGGRSDGGGGGAADVAAAQILAFIGGNPGLRSEQIQRETGLQPPVVKAALARLRSAGRVKTSGTRRATTYTLG